MPILDVEDKLPPVTDKLFNKFVAMMEKYPDFFKNRNRPGMDLKSIVPLELQDPMVMGQCFVRYFQPFEVFGPAREPDFDAGQAIDLNQEIQEVQSGTAPGKEGDGTPSPAKADGSGKDAGKAGQPT